MPPALRPPRPVAPGVAAAAGKAQPSRPLTQSPRRGWPQAGAGPTESSWRAPSQPRPPGWLRLRLWQAARLLAARLLAAAAAQAARPAAAAPLAHQQMPTAPPQARPLHHTGCPPLQQPREHAVACRAYSRIALRHPLGSHLVCPSQQPATPRQHAHLPHPRTARLRPRQLPPPLPATVPCAARAGMPAGAAGGVGAAPV